MNYQDFKEKLDRSIKVVDLPNNYNPKDIEDLLTKVGAIMDIIRGQNEMIITYSSTLEKELSKMYDGCPIKGNKNLKLEDPFSFDVKIEEPKMNSSDIKIKRIECDNGSANKFSSQTKNFNFDKSPTLKSQSIESLGEEDACNIY